MLQVDVRELRRGHVETSGELEPGDLIFHGLDLRLEGPLAVDGLLETAGPDGFFWRGRFEGKVRFVCRRCLSEFVRPLESRVDVMFSADPELQDDPSVYPLAEPVTQVDVRPAVREELALAVDRFPLCREECRGLCQCCGADLNRGDCDCPPSP
ncbi:MAG: YceD family protein [Gemmatimonadales bacterium]